MKIILIYIIFLININVLTAQKYDSNWVIGYPNWIYNFDSTSIYLTDTFTTAQSLDFFLSGGCMSDKNGNLLYISNGLKINDRNDNLMEGGDQLALGAFDTSYGYDFSQSPLSLPMPGSDSLYYFFYEAYWDTTLPQGSRLYYGIIDMSANNGLGKVQSLNHILIDTFISDAGLSACKHANGVDWWVIKPAYNQNSYYRLLVKANGIVEGPFIQSIGLSLPPPDYNSELVFSPQGDKMFYSSGPQKAMLFNFDRCTGLLSNPRYTLGIDVTGQLVGGNGASFSPNGRFVYLTGDSFRIYQLDTYSDNIDSSKIVILRYNTIQANNANYHQLAPNGKIYINGYGSPTPLSIISFPDSFGLACGLDTFSYDSLPYSTWGMSNFPYYRTPPARSYQADAGHDTTICFGDTVMLGTPLVDSVLYQWQSNSSLLSSTAIAQPLAQPLQTTSYYLTINDTVPRGYSCNVRIDTVTVYVLPLPCALGIDEAGADLAAGFKLYPNPAKDYAILYYNIPINQNATLSVYNQLGQLVIEQKLAGTSGSYTILCNPLSDGVYNYRFILNGQPIKREKFVVVH